MPHQLSGDHHYVAGECKEGYYENEMGECMKIGTSSHQKSEGGRRRTRRTGKRKAKKSRRKGNKKRRSIKRKRRGKRSKGRKKH